MTSREHDNPAGKPPPGGPSHATPPNPSGQWRDGDALDPGLHQDLRGKLDYATYLELDRVLAAQKPLSPAPAHDELLFIVMHQASELWFKLIIHELQAAIAHVSMDNLEPCFKILARVKHVQALLTQQWDVLATMTPADYAQFRPYLGPSSGFQSQQNRMIEFLLGLKDQRLLRFFDHAPKLRAELESLLTKPSLYDAFLRYLSRRGLPIPREVLTRDVSQRYTAHEGVVEALALVYRDPERFWDAYEMAEKLIDVDDLYAQWRFRHYTVVERVIGMKRGTGGSAGAAYLRDLVHERFFPELWTLRTRL
ncbi:MAG: tryptophan 2,3-dioxygenase family protein [Planctomycetota bacterium]|nr:tryptophan 2,3-dioxygenase family protein [Planctomycetota bacterium]